MLPSKRTFSFMLALAAAGCGGSPSAPTSAPSSATATVSGTVTQPGGAPVAGVLVQASPGGSGSSEASGRYSFTRYGNSYNFSASKAGYETRRLWGSSAPTAAVFDFTIAPVFRVPAGDTAAFTMLPDEPGYPSSDTYFGPADCAAPCRLIRVVAPIDRAGVVTITVTARNSAAELEMFLDGPDGLEHPICCKREHVLETYLLPNAELAFYVRFTYSPESAKSVDIVTTFRAQ